MLLSTQEETIRRIVLALSIIPLSLAAAHASSSTARSLALPRSDYPAKAQVVALPATNAQADRLLGPAHHSSFDQLHRLDGLGWLQAAVWHFKTGKGRAVQDHQTVFGYGINVFHSGAQARRALTDVKIKPKTFKVSRLSALLFQSTDVRQTLLFVFFAYKSVEVEAYYEYTGVAPAKMAKRLHHIFSRQSSHLAHLARLLSRSLGQSPVAPTATASATAMPTATVTATAAPPSPSPTATRVPTLTATPTALPAATSTPPPTPTAAPTATPTPAGFVVQAQMSSQAYAPDSRATVQVQVTQDGKPVAGATLSANFQFPKKPDTCVGTTDQTGAASCSVVVPKLPDGLQVQVDVQVVGPKGDNVAEVLTFTVHAVAAE